MPADPAASGPARLICRCLGVSSRRVERAVRAEGLSAVEQIATATGAGSGCSTCHPELEELLAHVHGRPVSEAQARENRGLCHAATTQRLETALFQGVVRKLPPGTEIELIAVDGLTVDLHIHGPDDAELREHVAERLRKLVCIDLDVIFS